MTSLRTLAGAMSFAAVLALAGSSRARGTPSDEELHRIVSVATDRQLHPINEADAQKVLSQFGEVKRTEDNPDICSFDVMVRPDLYVGVGYKKDANGSWSDPEFGFSLFGPDQIQDTFATLSRSVTEKLGKPWRTKKVKGKAVAAVWKLKGPLKVWLSRVVESGPGHPTAVDHIELEVTREVEEVGD
jgi:hypothetical protein